MPVFHIATNLPKNKIPSEFLKETSELVAKALGKPESYVCVDIAVDQMMKFGGSDDPCAVCVLKSLGCVGPSVNNKHAGKLYKHLNEKLNLKSDRVYIEFVNLETSAIAFNGQTFG